MFFGPIAVMLPTGLSGLLSSMNKLPPLLPSVFSPKPSSELSGFEKTKSSLAKTAARDTRTGSASGMGDGSACKDMTASQLYAHMLAKASAPRANTTHTLL